MTLGERLQRLRRARGMTQEQLAERIGVSRQSLSGWENDAALPDTVHVVALAELFGVTTDYLLLDDPTPRLATPADVQAQAAAASKRTQWRMSARVLGAWLIVGSALIGLVVLRVMASIHPARVGIDGRNYTGFPAFLYYYDLWWLLRLLLVVLALGLLQWFGPWLWKQGKRLLRWICR